MPIDVQKIVDELDAEIERLKNIRAALDAEVTPKKRGRPAGTKNATTDSTPAKKRTMSPEARTRIAAARKKRWAAKKKKCA